MTSTMKKLSEAQFFLTHLETDYPKNINFDYFLSAYISSSRSVLWVMRAEYQRIEGWGEWYNSVDPSKEEKLFLKKINDIRVRAEKIEPLTTNFLLYFEVSEEYMTEGLRNYLERMEGKELDVTINSIEEDMTDIKNGACRIRARLDKLFRSIKDFPDFDILEICKEYFSKIEYLVNECHKLFVNQLEKA